jgi:hypothetical protein
MSSRLERAREAQRKVDLAFALRNAQNPVLPVSSGVPQPTNPVASTDPHTAVPQISEQCRDNPDASTAHRAVAQNHNPSPAQRTDDQQRAARENGAKSSGPITDVGKMRSRINATKHGMRCQSVATLPSDMRAEVQAEIELLNRRYRPADHLEQRLVEMAALACVRHLRLETAERAAAQARVRGARRAWNMQRVADVAALMERLTRNDDAAARAALVATTHGCRALARLLRTEARRLELPDTQLDRGAPLRACGLPYEPLHPDDLDGHLLTFWRAVYAMQDSSGIALAKNRTHPTLWMRLTQDAPTLEAARADVIAFLYEQSEALMIRSRNIWRDYDAPARDEAAHLAAFDPSPEGKLLARYMNEAARTFRQSIMTLESVRKGEARRRKEEAAIADAPNEPRTPQTQALKPVASYAPVPAAATASEPWPAWTAPQPVQPAPAAEPTPLTAPQPPPR